MTNSDRHPPAPRLLRPAAALGLLLALVLGLGGCQGRPRDPAAAPPVNIVLIVIDTLRADHLGCYGYFRDTSPSIDAFADEAILFEQAYAPMATTLPSHTSLFTGLYPLEHAIVANVGDGGQPFRSRAGLRAVAELARSDGCTTAAFVSATPLKSVCGLNAGFDVYDQPRAMLRKARETTDAALAWLSAHANARFFLFVHYFDPHVPYQPPPPYRALFQTDEELERHLVERHVPPVIHPSLCRGSVSTVTRQATNLYDGEIRFCDEHVGRLLEWLRQRELWDNSVIVVTADHGEGLNQHDWPQHGRTWNEQVHVPLLIRFPQSGRDWPRRFAPLVSLIDVFPTVLGQLDLSWAGAFFEQARGVDVLAPGFRERPLLAQRSARDCGEHGGPLYALTTRDWRYHYFEAGRELLFDRLADPHELQSVAITMPGRTEELRRQTLELVALLRESGKRLGAGKGGAVQLDPELQRQMEALGYLSGPTDAKQDDTSGSGALSPATRPDAQPNRP